MAMPDESLLTDAVLVMLRAELAPALVGDANVPSPVGGADVADLDAQPFFVLYQIPGGEVSIADGYSGGTGVVQNVRYQITAVGIERSQAGAGSAKALTAMAEAALSVAGHAILWRRFAGRIPTESLGTTQAGFLFDVGFTVT